MCQNNFLVFIKPECVVINIKRASCHFSENHYIAYYCTKINGFLYLLPTKHKRKSFIIIIIKEPVPSSIELSDFIRQSQEI